MQFLLRCQLWLSAVRGMMQHLALIIDNKPHGTGLATDHVLTFSAAQPPEHRHRFVEFCTLLCRLAATSGCISDRGGRKATAARLTKYPGLLYFTSESMGLLGHR